MPSGLNSWLLIQYEPAMNNVEPLLFLSGVNRLSSDQPEWTLHLPEHGERAIRVLVSFEQPFQRIPIVQVALTGFDVSNETTARLRVRAENITANGFEFVVETWLNSQVWSVDLSWLAIGA